MAEADTSIIKAIEAGTVHRIQSGQVIVDLCSVAKELVENSIDAGATSIEVRFKNQGLDCIEVQDNGSGISPQNYETVALKHYTSKLSSYADLDTLDTFGFRGEALSSLCALSKFTVTTCLKAEVPKGRKLEFETSGKLKGASIIATQKGTIVSVENLFHNLPVRRRELERNIKREWGKVVSLLNQYACIQTHVKFTVSQQPNKGKRIVLFSTKGNATTRENIVNVFGAKTLAVLIPLDLKLELELSRGPRLTSQPDDDATKEIIVRGHVSRPAHGEGRQTPDRQMFFVNGRPCGLPQFAKVFNEVYRTYNASQSPFIFADILLDTHLYDVNVSPDKRTILLHEQARMLDGLRENLVQLFETQDYSVPVTLIGSARQAPHKKPPTMPHKTSGSVAGDTAESLQDSKHAANSTKRHPTESEDESDSTDGGLAVRNARTQNIRTAVSGKSLVPDAQELNLITRWVERKIENSEEAEPFDTPKQGGRRNPEATSVQTKDVDARPILHSGNASVGHSEGGPLREASPISSTANGVIEPTGPASEAFTNAASPTISDTFAPDEEYDQRGEGSEQSIPTIAPTPRSSGVQLPSTMPSWPLKRNQQEVATITIGDQTVTSVIGSPSKRQKMDESASNPRSGRPSMGPKKTATLPSFGGRLTQMFSASGSGSQALIDEEAPGASEEEHDLEDGETDEEGLEATDQEGESRTDPASTVSEQDESSSPTHAETEGPGGDRESSPSLFVDEEEARAVDMMVGNTPGSEKEEEDEEEEEDEDEDDAEEEERVQKMADDAEETKVMPSEEEWKRTQQFLKGSGKRKDATAHLKQRLPADERSIATQLQSWVESLAECTTTIAASSQLGDIAAEDAEAKLSLKISKSDFGRMKIVGQFNLGFILAIRPAAEQEDGEDSEQDDELFIIDQHATDEKYNFERLQNSTIVQSQRLVHPRRLELTALEEEIILENLPALESNGFVVEVDESGDEPVGQRCQLRSLPLSRETTFSLADLEELIALLGDHDSAPSSSVIPRPSKVRKMFAMRACRSSVMIGKALNQRQMERLVRHMGEIDKPWNCPHGRPTMRHLCGLGGAWKERSWQEGDDFEASGSGTDWAAYLRETKEGEA